MFTFLASVAGLARESGAVLGLYETGMLTASRTIANCTPDDVRRPRDRG